MHQINNILLLCNLPQAVPGAECFISANDIPEGGENNFAQAFGQPEEVLCSGHVLYAGQPVGLIVAGR